MSDIRRNAERARRLLRSYKGRPPQQPCSRAMRWWHLKYTALICDFMCEELPDEALSAWTEVFTALHELAGMGYRHFEEADVVTEEQAWRRVDPEEHMVFCRMFSLNPPATDPIDYCPEYQAFISFLGRRGVLSVAVAEALGERYAALPSQRAA